MRAMCSCSSWEWKEAFSEVAFKFFTFTVLPMSVMVYMTDGTRLLTAWEQLGKEVGEVV